MSERVRIRRLSLRDQFATRAGLLSLLSALLAGIAAYLVVIDALQIDGSWAFSVVVLVAGLVGQRTFERLAPVGRSRIVPDPREEGLASAGHPGTPGEIIRDCSGSRLVARVGEHLVVAATREFSLGPVAGTAPHKMGVAEPTGRWTVQVTHIRPTGGCRVVHRRRIFTGESPERVVTDLVRCAERGDLDVAERRLTPWLPWWMQRQKVARFPGR